VEESELEDNSEEEFDPESDVSYASDFEDEPSQNEAKTGNIDGIGSENVAVDS
jgi:hypothetical protein